MPTPSTHPEPCLVLEYKQGRNSISFVHAASGGEIVLVSGKRRQAVVRAALAAAGTSEFRALRNIGYAARPPRKAVAS